MKQVKRVGLSEEKCQKVVAAAGEPPGIENEKV